MNIYVTTNSRSARPSRLIATAGFVALAALVAPGGASASSSTRPHRVQAQIERGTLDVKGTPEADAVALRLSTGDPTRIDVDLGDDGDADSSFARVRVAAIDVSMGAGDDSVRIDDANGPVTDTIPATIGGGADDDSLNGGLGPQTFKGGAGNDTVIGGRGNDVASLGRGKDTFQWDPGDGSDGIEGGDGGDTMVFNGAAVPETMTMSAIGRQLVFLRDVGSIVMVTDGVEAVDVNALGGADNVAINDLTGTDVSKANIELAENLGGDAGDGAVDNVVVNATNRDDTIDIEGSASGVDVTGLAAAVLVKHPDQADTLSVNTLAGTDQVATNGVAGVMQVKVDGAPV